MNINPESVDGVTRRELFRLAAENKLIVDVDLWMDFHQARNSASHIYDDEVAEATLATALESIPCIEDFVARLEKRQ